MENTNNNAEIPQENEKSASKKPLIIAVALVLCAVLVGGCIFGVKEYKRVTTETISGIFTAEELSSLEKYPSLSYADLSGSTCYDEILAYENAHPEVDVFYTVNIGERTVTNKDTSLDWAGMDIGTLAAVNAEYLPALTSIDLGSAPVSSAELDKLTAAFPDAELSFTAELGGKVYSCSDTAIDLSKLTSRQVSETAALLRHMRDVNSIELDGADIDIEDYMTVFDACPDADINYSFELFGKTVTTHTNSLKYKKVSIGDEGIEYFRTLLPYLPNLTYLSFDRCDTTDEVVNQLRDDFPDVKIAWRIFFGEFSCMTDVEKIWAIGSLYQDNVEPIKYCRDVKYLDLGHNMFTSVEFLKDMYQLEVLIFGCGDLSDISAMWDFKCAETLEYLELSCCEISDLSPLERFVNLKHLELSICPYVKDISAVIGLKNLERFYAMYDPNIPQSQKQEFIATHPDCEVAFIGNGSYDPYNESHWRFKDGGFAPRYALLREQIGYDDEFGATRLWLWRDNDEE